MSGNFYPMGLSSPTTPKLNGHPTEKPTKIWRYQSHIFKAFFSGLSHLHPFLRPFFQA